MGTIRKIGSLSLMLFLLGACALSEDVVPINYAPMSDVAPIGAESKAFKVDVADKRGVYRGQIGAKVNGFGEEMAAIRSTVPVREIVRDALMDELKARNIKFDAKNKRSVEVVITAMHNNFKVGFWSGSARGIVTLNVNVFGPDRTNRFKGTISEIHEFDGIQLASGENAAKALEGALAKAMRKLFDNTKFVETLRTA